MTHEVRDGIQPRNKIGVGPNAGVAASGTSSKPDPDVGTQITHRVPPYSPGEVFMPTCPVQRCAASCDPDALYCSECGARLYLISSGKYGAAHATAKPGA